jgi:exopolysaccharide biosynthesis polyprenyl glycosylphosphotransferase
VKKNLAAFRYIDENVIPISVAGSAVHPLDDGVEYVSSLGFFFKRLIDIVFSIVVIVFGFPFYLLIAAMIKLSSPGPVLFVQKRVGQNGKLFKFYKFRTMTQDNDDEVHRNFTENFIKGKVMESGCCQGKQPAFKIAKDPRVTSVGKFLRRTSLDELPQFLNVLKGEMSLVGPRPPLPYELTHYKEWHKKRLLAKPGLTGYWQINGRSAVPFDEMVMLDLYYYEHWSLLLDLKIIFGTVPVMLKGSGGF